MIATADYDGLISKVMCILVWFSLEYNKVV